MNVFEFDKTLLERLDEAENVLQCTNSAVPASQVRGEWAQHIELQIEPAGWQALWRIPRAACEALNIRYPTVIFGDVKNVFFCDLKAEFAVIAVEDDDVHLNEVELVPLEDLWPTIDQENPEINAEMTADCIDQWRFFLRNIWLPWDDESDDEADWSKKHLKSRIKFCLDLKRGMSQTMAAHIRMLLNEARYIRNRRELIEHDMRDEEDDENFEESILYRDNLKELMKLHLRMTVIRNEIELLENPEMREIYQEINFKNVTKSDANEIRSFIVATEDTLGRQIEYFNAVRAHAESDERTKVMPSLKECLKISSAHSQIFIPSDYHVIKFVEPLHSNGSIRGITNAPETDSNRLEKLVNFDEKSLRSNRAVIASEENNSILMVFSGNFVLENILLDCRNVRLGLWCRAGVVTIKNCIIVGDHSSSTSCGIVVAPGATCIIENSIVQNFATGVSCNKSGSFTAKHSLITDCRVGIEMSDENRLECDGLRLENASEYGIVFVGHNLTMSTEAKNTVLSSSMEWSNVLKESGKTDVLCGNVLFTGNKRGNIVITNREKETIFRNSAFIEDNSDSEEDSALENVSLVQLNDRLSSITNGHETSIIVID